MEIKDLQSHWEMQAKERQRKAKNRKKSYEYDEKYMTIIIDGMDHNKTNLPHFKCVPKDLKEENFI